MRKTPWKSYAPGIAAVAFALISAPASAQCDFTTGGGFIITTANSTHPPAKANFGVGGGCKQESPTFGHLQYIDHGSGLKVHWLTITGYFDGGGTGTDSKGHPTGVRFICGTARTNQFGDVDFIVRVADAGEPGVDDEFDILLAQNGNPVYLTVGEGFPHKLQGGNIELHKPTAGGFGGSCAAASPQ